MFNLLKKSKLGFVILVLFSSAVYASHAPQMPDVATSAATVSILHVAELSEDQKLSVIVGGDCDPASGSFGVIVGGDCDPASGNISVLVGLTAPNHKEFSEWRLLCWIPSAWNLLKNSGSYLWKPKK